MKKEWSASKADPGLLEHAWNCHRKWKPKQKEPEFWAGVGYERKTLTQKIQNHKKRRIEVQFPGEIW